MEKDVLIKQILSNSASGASPGFTDSVMKKVAGLSAVRSYYRPLVSPGLIKIFLFVFGSLVVSILVLCLVMAFEDAPIGSWLQNIRLPDINYNKTLVFMVTFWIVFAVNALVEKKFSLRGTW